MYEIDYGNIKKGYKYYRIWFITGLVFFIIFAYCTFGGFFRKLSMDGEVKAYKVITTKLSVKR